MKDHRNDRAAGLEIADQAEFDGRAAMALTGRLRPHGLDEQGRHKTRQWGGKPDPVHELESADAEALRVMGILAAVICVGVALGYVIAVFGPMVP